MKLKMFILVVFILVLGINSFTYANKGLAVYVNDKIIDFEKEGMPRPYISETNRTMVPVRVISEKLGFTVRWQAYNTTVVITDNKDVVVFRVGEAKAIKNSKEIPIDTQDGKVVDTKSVIKDNRTFVPLRFIVESFNAKVTFVEGGDADVNKIMITLGSNVISPIGTPKVTPKVELNETGQEVMRDQFGDINPCITKSENGIWEHGPVHNQYYYPRNAKMVFPELTKTAVADRYENIKIINDWLKDAVVLFTYGDSVDPDNGRRASVQFNIVGTTESHYNNFWVKTDAKYSNDGIVVANFTTISMNSWPTEISSMKEREFIPILTEKILKFYLPTEGEKLFKIFKKYQDDFCFRRYDESKVAFKEIGDKVMFLDNRYVILINGGQFDYIMIGDPGDRWTLKAGYEN